MEKEKYATKIITDLSQVPDGYKRLSEVAPRDTNESRNTHRVLSDAHMKGHVRAVKLVRTVDELRTGVVFIHVADSEDFIRHRQGKAAAPKVLPCQLKKEAEAFDCEGLIGAMESLRHAVAALSSNVRDLQAATELRIERDSGEYA